jgi:hypothetical protein
VETWESTDSLGNVVNVFGRQVTIDGNLLATAIGDTWVDIASGESWATSQSLERNLAQDVANTLTKIEREFARGLTGVSGEMLDRPRVIFPAGEFEYQIANQLIQRQTRWLEHEDGTREKISELTVVDFAMLPPGSFPRFAQIPGN